MFNSERVLHRFGRQNNPLSLSRQRKPQMIGALRRGGEIETRLPKQLTVVTSLLRVLTLDRKSAPFSVSVMAFYEKVIKVKADVAAYLICFPSA
jgi:hypothetical protein